MFNALGVLLEVGRGVGLVRSPSSIMEKVEGLFLRYASGIFSGILKVRSWRSYSGPQSPGFACLIPPRGIQVMQYVFVVMALLSSATAMYSLVYHVIMPTKLHDKALYFNYGARDCTQPQGCT
jgi:hypothetical protein